MWPLRRFWSRIRFRGVRLAAMPGSSASEAGLVRGDYSAEVRWAVACALRAFVTMVTAPTAWLREHSRYSRGGAHGSAQPTAPANEPTPASGTIGVRILPSNRAREAPSRRPTRLTIEELPLAGYYPRAIGQGVRPPPHATHKGRSAPLAPAGGRSTSERS